MPALLDLLYDDDLGLGTAVPKYMLSVELFGIKTSKTGAQNDTAWTSMLSTLNAEIPHPQRANIEFGRGNYNFDTTKTLDRALNIYGQGTGAWNNGAGSNEGTRCSWPVGTTALIVSPQDVGTGNQRNSDGIIKGIHFFGGDSATDPPPIAGSAHGLILYSRMFMEDVTVSGFRGDGVRIIGGTGLGPGGVNCFSNQGTMLRCRQYYNGGNGVTWVGADANQWFVHSDASANRGWGFDDNDSLLGNHFYATHNSINLGGPFRSSATGWSSFHGCYTEGGSPGIPAVVTAKSIVIGGDHGAGFSTTSGGIVINADGSAPYLRAPLWRSQGHTGDSYIAFDHQFPNSARLQMVSPAGQHYAGFGLFSDGLNLRGNVLAAPTGMLFQSAAGHVARFCGPSFADWLSIDAEAKFLDLLSEIGATPANPAANGLRLYIIDAAGQTTLRARDSAGNDQQIWPPTGGSSGPTQGQVWHVATGRAGGI